MTMTPIERAARALWDLNPLTVGGADVGYDMPIPWDRVEPGVKEDLLAEVRVVLQAIREPSDAMLPDPHRTDTPLYEAVRVMED
jgi:hypothetical protein